MKKFIKIIIVIVVLVLCYIGYSIFFTQKENVQTKQEGEQSSVGLSISGGGQEAESEVVETNEGVVYTGKVIPVETRYYTKDSTKEFKGVYVNAGDLIEKGKVLFDYYPDYSADAQIEVLNKGFSRLQQELNDYYSRIEEYKSWLAGSSDNAYNEYLRNEIKNTEELIAKNKVEWIKAEESIRKLRDGKDDYFVKSEISGLVYAVNKDNTLTPSNNISSFVTVYSLEKKVRISVSEYEYKTLQEGEKVKVKIEGLNKEYEGTIIKIDSLPNNLESSDTSYYNVDVSIEDEVPYGYTAVVTVKK
ncbi:MAG: efflux RND transporter periplasmic adaptor subunit [Erysipelotrichaceae bacterium]|nr:efflux RND transporter periplasmic adaptor subunit [Erysipelotrichaceae bacterium]